MADFSSAHQRRVALEGRVDHDARRAGGDVVGDLAHAAGRETVLPLTPEAMAHEYLALYERLLAGTLG